MHGQVFSGTTTVTFNGASTATVMNCPGTTAASTCTTTSLDITAKPIIYVQNAAACSLTPYSPYDVSYPTTTVGSNYYGCEGDVYVKGNYSASFTIAAANDIVVTGDLTTAHDGSGQPTGPAVLGVGREQVRARDARRDAASEPQLSAVPSSEGGNVTNVTNPNQTLTSPTIDAAILAVQHSWIVDNFDCGAKLQNLTVNGAIAQYYRGPVAVTGTTGYLKDYTYDDRLHVTLPPVSVRHRDLGLARRPRKRCACPAEPAPDRLLRPSRR